MKYAKLFLLFVLIFASCSAPAISVPTQTLSPTNTLEFSGTSTVTITPDAAMGNIEGDLSWLDSSTSTSTPIKRVNLEINGHSGDYPRYTSKVDQNGHFKFANIEPGDYGFGIYFNLPFTERLCEAPEYIYGTDLGWLHYATWLKGDVWYDILFSNTDVLVEPGETVVLDFVLKCP